MARVGGELSTGRLSSGPFPLHKGAGLLPHAPPMSKGSDLSQLRFALMGTALSQAQGVHYGLKDTWEYIQLERCLIYKHLAVSYFH